MATHEAKMMIWHDLTEDPEDLPQKKCGRYLLSAHYKDDKIAYPYIYTLTDCSYFPKGYWYDRDGRELASTTVVVAWAEMPGAYIPESKKIPEA